MHPRDRQHRSVSLTRTRTGGRVMSRLQPGSTAVMSAFVTPTESDEDQPNPSDLTPDDREDEPAVIELPEESEEDQDEVQ